MKSSKSKVKSIVQGTLLGAGLLMATSVFADGVGHGHGHGRDFDDHRGHEWHDRDFDRDHRDHGDWGRHHDFDRPRHDYDHDRGGIRLVFPFPPRPPVFFPIPRPPHVTFSYDTPAPEYITYAQVVDVDPIITRSNDGWDDRTEERCDGYRVTYVFRGNQYTTVMSYDPGSRVRIKVGRGIEVLG